MKIRGSIFLSVALVLLLIGANNPLKKKNDSPEKEAMVMQTMLEGLKQLHFQHMTLDDAFSTKAYHLYLDRIDGGRRYLTQEDIKKLKGFENELDDEALAGQYTFFNTSLDLLNDGIEKAKEYYREILSQPFDFTKEEFLNTDYENKAFAKNDAELKEYWRKNLKNEVLSRVYNKLKDQKKAAEKENEDGEEVEIKSFEQLEKEAREKVADNYDKMFKRIAKLRRSDRFSAYLNAITGVYDPHTGYFAPKDKEDFDIGLSGTLEGIGATLSTSGDYTKIVNIIPGGPAWKQKQLESEDLIYKVAQDNEEPVDITGMRLDDVVKMIRGKKGTKVTLTVKKEDGSFENITITRDVVIIEERYAKSVIVGKDEIQNIGFIHLPQFYADFNGNGGHSSARDIAKEIEKLNAQNVQGIILDLRSNSGGSLRDAVRMSGLFIEKGPIVQVKGRGKNPEVLEDVDPRVQYNGPLIVLVNYFSASASEILAAALQDYDRAIIVGSKSTFGKGTVQRFFNLDRALRGYDDIKPLGQVKLTIQKFYRINGGSTQLKGVTPDIVLPDKYNYIDIGEREHDYALPWTEINAVDYHQDVTTLSYKETLKKRSALRVAESEVFAKIDENALRYKRNRDIKESPLAFDSYKTFKTTQEEEAEKYKNIQQPVDGLVVTNLEVDMKKINMDESRQAMNEDWVKALKKDAYLNEALSIMHDMIELEK